VEQEVSFIIIFDGDKYSTTVVEDTGSLFADK
jgi:hypothetical protein